MCFNIRDNDIGEEILIDGAQLIGLDWEKQPFVESKRILATEKCEDDFEEMVYDIWLGLVDTCFCQEGSDLDGTQNDGGCKGKEANSPYCRSRPPINPVVQSNLNGFKFCGKRAGENFLNAKRPQSIDGSPFECPEGTVPCDADALENGNE